ncbi:hypothetical protein FALBO_8002 [Fusarium albosuccineum]|uniref:Uncharacterized protein n=1 Tax=Fusarium albosuccineum TaxID=1237068 RepID=A0A8H4LCR5_9HYPO|nr:hypothetical protein FALBO_8002 [Fusarium albosuccineum]
MSEVVTTAIAKLQTLWNICLRWHSEVNSIKNPQHAHQEDYQTKRARFDQEVKQLARMPRGDAYQQCSNKIFELAGDINRLETEYAQLLSVREQDFRKQLDVFNRDFAYTMIEAFGDTLADPWIQDRLRMVIIPQELTAEMDTAVGEANTAPDPVTNLETNPGLGENVQVDAHAAADTNPSLGTNTAPEGSAPEDPTSEENQSAGEAQFHIPQDNTYAAEDVAPEVPAPEVPAPEADPVRHNSPVPDTNVTPQMRLDPGPISDLGESLGSQTNPSTQMNLTTEVNSASETNPSLETNVLPETTVQEASPNTQSIPLPDTNLTPASDPASEKNMARDETTRGVKEQHELKNTTASQAAARTTSPNQHDGSQTDAPPARSSNNHRQPSDPPAVNLRTPRKRPAATTLDQQQKRPRYADMPIASTDSVVDFDEVFQDGNARVNYLIAQYPARTGEWYILECKEHGKHFVNNPVLGAAKHLAGLDHGLTREHSLAVSTLGTRVLNCNATLAEKNNVVARDAFSKQLGLPPRSRDSNKRTRPPMTESDRPLHHHGEQTQSQESPGIPLPEGILIPVVGEIYAVRYPRIRFLYPVLVLSWPSFEHFEWKESLLRITPSCYLFDRKLDQYPRGWAKGYEDGGPLVSQRQYPVIYFDGRQFPKQSSVGWLPVSSFKAFDPEDTSIGHRNSVAEFLQHKDPRFTAVSPTSVEKYVVISDDSDSDDPDTSNGVKQEDSEKGFAHDKRSSDNADENAVGKGSEDNPNGQSQANGHQEQTEQNFYSEKRSSGDEAVPSQMPSRQDVNQDPQVQSHIRRVSQQHTQPTVPSAPQRRIEPPFVTGESLEAEPAGHLPPASGDSSKQPMIGIQGQRAVALGSIGQSSQPALQKNPSQSQHSFTPSGLSEEEDLAALAAEARAVMSTASKWFDDEPPAPVSTDDIRTHDDIYDTRTRTSRVVIPQHVRLQPGPAANSDPRRLPDLAPKPCPQQQNNRFLDAVRNAHARSSKGPVFIQQNASC